MRSTLFPPTDWLAGYQRPWLKADVLAGLTTAAVVIPKAMAYATIAGLPVEIGLYTALVPMAVYAVLGTSRPLSVSTTTTLAAVVIATSVGLIHLADFRAILRFRTREFRWALVACVGVVVLGTLKGILAAVILSMLSLLNMANNPPIHVLRRKRGTDVFRPVSAEHPDDEPFPGLLILRTEGTVYFGNAQNIGDGVWPLVREARPKVVLLDCGGIPGFEFTALKMLGDAEAKLRDEGVELWLAALSVESLGLVRGLPLGEILGRERMFFTVERAVDAYLERHSPRGDAAAEAVPSR